MGEIEEPPSFGTNVRLDYLTGMGKVGKGFVLLLDADRVLTASEVELAAQAAALASASEACRRGRRGRAAADAPAPSPSTPG